MAKKKKLPDRIPVEDLQVVLMELDLAGTSPDWREYDGMGHPQGILRTNDRRLGRLKVYRLDVVTRTWVFNARDTMGTAGVDFITGKLTEESFAHQILPPRKIEDE